MPIVLNFRIGAAVVLDPSVAPVTVLPAWLGAEVPATVVNVAPGAAVPLGPKSNFAMPMVLKFRICLPESTLLNLAHALRPEQSSVMPCPRSEARVKL